MATDVEMDLFLEECEQRLSCHYVRPHCTQVFPDATRLTRYLFPMSLQAVGIQSPNPVMALLLVANIAPRTFWNEVEEAFEETAHTHMVIVLKTKTHPSSAVTHQGAKISYLLIELSCGQVVLLEYCQAQTAELVDTHGRLPSNPDHSHPLLNRARNIQRLATSEAGEGKGKNFSIPASRCMHLAHNSGILSGRLDLLTSGQLIDIFENNQEQWAMEEASDLELLTRIGDLATKDTAVGRLIPAIASSPPNSPGDGLKIFRDAHTLFVLFQVNYWAPGSRLLFADAFFDVIATVQHDLQRDGSHLAHAWPYHLTERTGEDGSSFYLIGIQRSAISAVKGVSMGDLEQHCSTDKIYDITQELLGYQFHVGKNGESDECYIQATVIGSDDSFFNDAESYLQKHVAHVRGLSLSALSKLGGMPSGQNLGNTEHQEVTDDNIASSISFRPGKKILNQLRWDPKFAGSRSYEVGYEDRFSDALLWLPIEDWVQTTEEDEFIPLHRIRQFRNIVTKEVVWDRAKRLDKLK